MSAGSRLWTALEAAPGLRAVPAVWQQRLGNDYVAASRFLRPDGNRASVHPCTAPQSCGCAHEIIEHAPDDIVSVCRCDPRRCDVRALTPADILLYEVNRRQLSDAVATALGVTPAHAAVQRLRETWLIGTHSPRPGARFPVFMTVQTEPDDFQGVVDALQARGEGPFALVAPTRDACQPVGAEQLRMARAHFIALAEEFTLGDDGTLAPCRPIADVLAPFHALALPGMPGAGQRRWGGQHLTAKEAAKALGHSSGHALRKAVDRSGEGDPLHLLHQGGFARTPGGKFYEEAVAHVAGLIGGVAEQQYHAGVAERMAAAKAAKAATKPPDPRAAERRLLQALARKEKQGR